MSLGNRALLRILLSPHRMIGVLLRLLISCFLLVLSCHSPIIIHALVELKPQARRMQERAAAGW